MSAVGIAHIVGMFVLAASLAGAVYGALATRATARFLRGAAGSPARSPPLTILRPMKGVEPEFDANLSSLCAQDYAGAVRIVLGADRESDPSIKPARALRANHPDRDIHVVTDPTLHGANRKLGNLINMSGLIHGEILVISDSDVRLPPDGLSAMAAELEKPGVGLVYGLYRGRPAGNLWSRLAALDINARFAPSVVVGQAVGAHPVLGPTMMLRADVLMAGGGFERLRDVLADDFELGRMVREQGLAIACPPLLIDHVFPEQSLRDVWVHELRWARTIRLLNPGGYGGSAITHVLPLALVGAALTGFAPLASATLAVLAALRLLQCLLLCRLMRADKSVVWLFPLRDLLSFAVYLAAFAGDRIEWRGNRLRVKSDGAMASQ